MDRHALGLLDNCLAHLLGHVLVKLGGAAHCLLHVDLAQLLWANAASSKVLFEDVNNMVKAKK
jgi:hypothetical protein